jgi:hypothetical protein
MATRHILSLDVLDVSAPHILKIADTSVYADPVLLPVECPRLEIWLPGMNTAARLEGLAPGFVQSVSLRDLGLAGANPDDHEPCELPDGLYRIRYSVSPNDRVFVEYNHLRTVRAMNGYLSELCRVRLEACEPTPEQHQQLHDLRYIKQYLEAAKAKAEICGAPLQAVEMLAYAEKLLDRYRRGTCLTCR